MIDRLNNEFSFLQGAVGLRQQRMELLSSNIANADTPGYKARDFNFAEELDRAIGTAGSLPNVRLNMTSDRHLPAQGNGPMLFAPQYRVPHQASLDGNTVEMDVERMQFADNTMQQQASLSFVSSKIRSMMTALQPPN